MFASPVGYPNYTFYFVEYIGIALNKTGVLLTHTGSTTLISFESGPSIPRDGHVHSFHAHITATAPEVTFQIWRVQVDLTATLIGQENFVIPPEKRGIASEVSERCYEGYK